MKHARFVAIVKRILFFLLIVGGVCIVSCALLFVTVYIVIRTHFDGSGTLPADCAIVFGAAVYGYDTPGPAIVRRIGKAATLYRDGSINRFIFSGGVGKGSGLSDSEASVMRAEAERLGVRATDIILESNSHSTWENLLFARPLTVGCESVVGISDQFHLARIEFLAWRQGWGTLGTIPSEDRPPAISERASVIREMFAMVYYVFYLDVLFPGIQRSI